MSVQELKRGYDQLPEEDRILFASLVAADQLVRQGDYVSEVSRRQKAMDEGRKWSHEDVLRLDEELKRQGL